ncbi:hypothetical protein PQX77_004976 [Marasmius sp. AFHP31]|nr:hypothetical protein PQX77_004976 [Marasmius sp. AFHP31]
MEVYLCVLEHRFLQPISPSPTHVRPLALEWIRGMEDRISLDKESCRRRWSNPTYAQDLFLYQSTYDILARELRSLRQLPTDGLTIRRWTEIIDRPDHLPSASDLFELPPFNNLEKLRKTLLPVFTVDGQADVPTPKYHRMIAHLRTSLSRLRDARPSSPYDRIQLYGPGSPEFSPPYTKINQASEEISKALSLQIESVRMLQITLWHDNMNMQVDILRLLNSLRPSFSLTSVFLHQVLFDNESLCLVLAILQRHRRITCLLLDQCSPVDVDRTEIDKDIAANRLKWKEAAHHEGEFTYSVGCDINPARSDGNYSAVLVYQHDIALTNRGDVFAMIYLPQPGKIVLNLSLRLDAHDIALIAVLTRSGSIESSSATKSEPSYSQDPTVCFDVVESGTPEYEPVSIEGFPVLQTGCYELRIRLEKGNRYLFRKLAMAFIPLSVGEELGAFIEATEGATMIDEERPLPVGIPTR